VRSRVHNCYGRCWRTYSLQYVCSLVRSSVRITDKAAEQLSRNRWKRHGLRQTGNKRLDLECDLFTYREIVTFTSFNIAKYRMTLWSCHQTSKRCTGKPDHPNLHQDEGRWAVFAGVETYLRPTIYHLGDWVHQICRDTGVTATEALLLAEDKDRSGERSQRREASDDRFASWWW